VYWLSPLAALVPVALCALLVLVDCEHDVERDGNVGKVQCGSLAQMIAAVQPQPALGVDQGFGGDPGLGEIAGEQHGDVVATVEAAALDAGSLVLEQQPLQFRVPMRYALQVDVEYMYHHGRAGLTLSDI
ncbi:hypothetical protein GRF21_32955, partial [Pseudomonas aeruginosa]|uniref:hypothetical protein n=1 Tax=Pseudomonas aeruginosa TaxID=287 RepID=UPI001CA4EE51